MQFEDKGRRMYYKKVCIVGACAVGKTSLVRRFLDADFNPAQTATVGAAINKKVLEIEGEKLQLMLWDIEGQSQLSDASKNYFKGASAMIYVVDGTRLDTLGAAVGLRLEIETHLGCSLPSIILFNKSDLADRWEISHSMINDAEVGGNLSILTSCSEGSGVNMAFNLIGRVLLGKTTLVAA